MDTIERLVDMSNRYEPVHDLKRWLRKNQQNDVGMRPYQHRIKFITVGGKLGREYKLLRDGDSLRGVYSVDPNTQHYHDTKTPMIVALEFPQRSGGFHIVRVLHAWHEAEYEWGLLREALMEQYRAHEAWVNLSLVMRAANDAAARWRGHLYLMLAREMADDTQAD